MDRSYLFLRHGHILGLLNPKAENAVTGKDTGFQCCWRQFITGLDFQSEPVNCSPQHVNPAQTIQPYSEH